MSPKLKDRLEKVLDDHKEEIQKTIKETPARVDALNKELELVVSCRGALN